jgi:probable H4MPT-linked C1 transfer pathway protein
MSTEKSSSVSSANWAATGWLIAKHLKNAVIVDVGKYHNKHNSSNQWKNRGKGQNRFGQASGGGTNLHWQLAHNIAAIVQSVPIRGGVSGVSSELFATSGDVYLILGHISAADFSAETADGRGRTEFEAKARLSRLVCADAEMLTDQEIVELARYVYSRQITQITDGLSRVYQNTKRLTDSDLPISGYWIRQGFSCQKAAEAIGADRIVDLDELLPAEAVLATPAVGVAFMTAK